jgi:hypothetical protein
MLTFMSKLSIEQEGIPQPLDKFGNRRALNSCRQILQHRDSALKVWDVCLPVDDHHAGFSS